MSRRLRTSTLLALCLLLFGILSSAFGQSASATLSGTIQDERGAVIPGAAVSVSDPAKGLKRQATTNEQGEFTVPLLPPSTYTVRVEGKGFAPAEVPNVVLNVGDQKALLIQLKAGDVNARVTIDPNAETVRTDGSVGTVVDSQFVKNIPMNGRSFQNLILLTPGATTNSPQSTTFSGYSGDLSINGQRTESNRYFVDGISANNGTYVYGYTTTGTGGALPTATALGTTQSIVSVDALQEFRVMSSSYSAEFGSSPGGQFSFVTKSGTSDLHGSGFEYLRNDALDANDWFNNSLRFPKAQESQNDFGGTIGGPVTIPRVYNGRDRTFFFFSYEGLRLHQPQAAQRALVPSLATRQSAVPAAKPLMNAFPLPNGATLPDGLAEYFFTDSVPSRLDSTSVRIDHNFGPDWRFYFRFSDTPSKSVTRYSTSYSTRSFKPLSYSFGLTGIVSPKITNELRVGFSPNEGSNTSEIPFIDGAQPVDVFQVFGIDRVKYPTAQVYLYLCWADCSPYIGAARSSQPQRQFNLSDNVNFVTGNHNFKFGINYLRTASDLQRSDPNTWFEYYSADDLAHNIGDANVSRWVKKYPVFRSFAAFVQDEWRVSRRLNLSLGLRWEVGPPPTAAKGIMPRVLSGTVTQPSTITLAPEGTALWKTTYNNFAPRFGLSYVLRDSAKFQTVLRTGVGVFFDNNQNLFASAWDNNPPLLYSHYYDVGLTSFPLTPAQLNIPDNSLTAPFSSYTFYQYGDPANPLKMPYTLQWNVAMEQSLGSSQSLTISYVGARGKRLLGQDQISLGSLNPNFPSIFLTRNGLTSSYDALQAQFQRRLSRGLQALASYTWSHSIDFGSNSRQLPTKRGDSDFDLRHSFTAAVTYNLPIALRNAFAGALLNHWSLDGRATSRTGFPVSLNGATIVDKSTGERYVAGLDLVPGVPLYIESASLPGGRQINPAAFRPPKSGVAGTAGRNIVRGFGATQFDAVLRRDFPFSEDVRLQFSVEAFNVFNQPNFGRINSTYCDPTKTVGCTFGQATQMLNRSLGGLSSLYQQGGPRSLQLGLRLTF